MERQQSFRKQSNTSLDYVDIKRRKTGVNMGKQSISEIKTLLFEEKLTETELALFKNDTRKGVQQLIAKYEKNELKRQALEKDFYEMCTYERNSRLVGKQMVAGIDEAGRGPLAGPVVAAAVILPEDFKLIGLNDSKQISETKRNEFFEFIKKNAISYRISVIDNQTIDRVNIFEATKLAMKEALIQLDPPADHVLIDAVRLDNLPCSSESIIKGDAKSISIAAASILAKVTRDQLMNKIHEEYPMYDFKSNMGYGTKYHMDALRKYGISPYHRKTFAPVRENI
jgi:ribonuclease HII